jgi:hypothetical protein
VFPEGVPITATYNIVGDTTTFVLHSDSLLEYFWITDFSDTVFQLIYFKVNGVEVDATQEFLFGTIYPSLWTMRFVWEEEPFHDIEIRYYGRSFGDGSIWTASAPAFGFQGVIGVPEAVRWH